MIYTMFYIHLKIISNMFAISIILLLFVISLFAFKYFTHILFLIIFLQFISIILVLFLLCPRCSSENNILVSYLVFNFVSTPLAFINSFTLYWKYKKGLILIILNFIWIYFIGIYSFQGYYDSQQFIYILKILLFSILHVLFITLYFLRNRKRLNLNKTHL